MAIFNSYVSLPEGILELHHLDSLKGTTHGKILTKKKKTTQQALELCKIMAFHHDKHRLKMASPNFPQGLINIFDI